MKPAITTRSANLRSGPGTNFGVRDELEPNYPLLVRIEQNGWYYVVAKAHGKRTSDQEGWIDSRFVKIVTPHVPSDDPPNDRHPPPLDIGVKPWAIAALLFIGALFLWALAGFFAG